MPMYVNTNISSINAQRNLTKTNSSLGKSLERLSSGLRINRAGDDAAGLAISEKLRSQVRGLNQAIRNANDGVSLIQTAEGAFNTVTNIVQRLRQLSVQAASDTNTSADRGTLKKEADLLIEEITRIGNTTEFNTKTLLNGSFQSGKVHIGANNGQSISFSLSDIRSTALGRRTSVTGNLTDGASNGINAGITAGELTVNGTRVVTTTGDDGVSVLEITGGTVGVSGLASGSLVINSVNIGSVDATASGTTASQATALAAAINAASITNITARVGSGDSIVFTAANGTDLKMQVATAGAASATGMTSDVFMASAAITTFNGQSSALSKAAAINAVRSTTNVSAKALSTTVTGSGAIASTSVSNGAIYINGVNIGAVTVAASDGSGTLVAAINAQTSETGVTATVDNNSQIVLEATDGRNITVSGNKATMDSVGLTESVTRSTVQMDSVEAITLAGTNVGELGTDTASATLTATTFQPDLTHAVSTIDISTQTGADDAILILDAALEQLNNNRAEVGALQNRLEMAVGNLGTTSENFSASESRIRDADFAFETAQFTKNQILAQAGTNILAQANTTSQLALQLLR
jgi:flagellin